MSLTLASLSKRLLIIVRRQQPGDKSRESKKFNDDESICKTKMVKCYIIEVYDKNQSVKIPTLKKLCSLVNSKLFLCYVDEINSCDTLS